MFYAVIRVALAAILGISFVATFGAVCAIAIGLIMAATRRKSTVNFISGMMSRNVLFRPELYQDNAQPWAKIHRYGFMTLFLSLALALITGLCLQAIL